MTKEIDLFNVPTFVREHVVGVLYVGLSEPPEQVFKALAGQGAHGAWVQAPNTFDTFFKFARPWLHDRQRAMGWEPSDDIPWGYYLFVGGEVRAFHPGLIDFKEDKLSVGMGIVALLAAFATKSGKSVRQAFDVAHLEAAHRVVSYFTPIIGAFKPYAERVRSIPPPPPPKPVDELTEAYGLLQLDEHATQADVKQRWKELAQKWHPDRHAHAQDHEITKHANAMLTQINAAYTLVCLRRGWKKRG